ncbi:MAG TPA: calcium-binding protein [Phycicoccus sp.]
MRRIALATALVAVAVTGPVHAAAPTCGGEPATIVGTAGADALVGTPGRDVVVGLDGADELRGRGGDDLLCGDGGRDVLRGGPGADLLDVGPDEGGEPDLITYDTAARGVSIDLRLGTATGQGRDSLVGDRFALHGSPYDDSLVGSEATIELAGLGGDDRITGTVGDDWIYGDGVGPNRMSGDDVLYGGAGADAIHPGRGDDVVSGGNGDDYVYAWEEQPSGSDLVYGGPGRDWIEDVLGPDDRDDYRAGGGWDTLWLRTRFVRDGRVTHPNGRMRLDGRWTTYGTRNAEGRVRDVNAVILPVGRWRLVGTDAAEHLWAPRGVSDPQRRGVTILGEGGDDNLIGTEYDDVLLGGGGTDEACGRGGRDEIEAEARAVDPIDLCDPR